MRAPGEHSHLAYPMTLNTTNHLLVLSIAQIFILCCQAPASQQPSQIEIQTGHTDTITAMTISSDGKFLITASDDNTAKLWEISTGIILRTFKSNSPIKTLAADPSNQRLATGSIDGDITVWDLSTGKEKASFHNDSAWMTSIAFNSNGTHLYAGDECGNINLWDLSSGAVMKSLSGFSDTPLFKTEHYLLAITAEGDFTLIDKDTADLVRSFKGKPQTTCFAMSEDEKIIVAGHNNGTVGLWDARTGKEIRSFMGEAARVSSIAISPDNKHLITNTSDNTLTIWDFATGKKLNSFKTEATVRELAVTLDSKYLAVAAFNDSVELRNILSGEPVRTFTGHASRISSIAITPNGKYLVTGAQYGSAWLWDLSTGRRILNYPASLVASITISPDGKFLATFDLNCDIRLWGLMDGKEISRLPVPCSGSGRITFTSDGNYIISIPEVGPARLWDLTTKREVRKFGRKEDQHTPIVALVPGGKSIIVDTTYNSASLWDISSGQEVMRYEVPDVDSMAVTPNGRHIVASGNPTKLLELNTGKLTRTFAASDILTITPDGNSVVTVMLKELNLWDLHTGTKTRSFRGHTGAIFAVAVAPNGKHLVSGGVDGTIRIWNITTGDHVALVGADASNDWILFTPDGYFDASPHGGELVSMVDGLTAFGIDQFAVRNNRPDLILERVGLGTVDQVFNYQTQYQRRLKKLNLNESILTGELHVPEAKITKAEPAGKFLNLSFILSDKKFKLKHYNIFINDVPLFGPFGKECGGHLFTGREALELTAGKNKIELSVMNETGSESYRTRTYAEYEETKQPAIYYLAFGISNYKDSTQNLGFADKDARDLEAFISKMTSMYSAVHTKVFQNSEVTAENIINSKEFLATAGVDDTVVLFLAGHGGYSAEKAPRYYYVPYEADFNNLIQTGVSFEDIENLLIGLKSRRKLLLMDTCESGELEEDIFSLYYNIASARGLAPRTSRKPKESQGNESAKSRGYLLERDRFIYNDLSRRTGAVVFSSSRGNELSYESTALMNGFFTRGLLSALASKDADTNSNGKVSIDELKIYVRKFVSEGTSGLQNPTIDRDNLSQKIEFPLLAD